MNEKLASYSNKFRETERVLRDFCILQNRLNSDRDEYVEYKKMQKS